MAFGNGIIVSANVPDRFTEGIITSGQTPKPGTIMQIDPTVAVVGGRHTYKIFNRGADGKRPLGPFYILLEDRLQGKTPSDAYAAGDRCFLYALQPGDEVNAIVLNIAGTGDDHAAGELLMVDDTTGKLVAFTGTPDTAPFILLESITDPTDDTLAWVLYSGH